jgi:hypothetical protein
VHNYYTADMSLAHRVKQTDTKVRRDALYENLAQVIVTDFKNRLRVDINSRNLRGGDHVDSDLTKVLK